MVNEYKVKEYKLVAKELMEDRIVIIPDYVTPTIINPKPTLGGKLVTYVAWLEEI